MMDKVYCRADLVKVNRFFGWKWSEINIKFVKDKEILNIYSFKAGIHEVGQTINLYE